MCIPKLCSLSSLDYPLCEVCSLQDVWQFAMWTREKERRGAEYILSRFSVLWIEYPFLPVMLSNLISPKVLIKIDLSRILLGLT